MYRWVEHTGELELEIEADSEEGVYRDALAAIAELLSEDDEVDRAPGGRAPTALGEAERRLAVVEPDRPGLLAAFLGELAFLAESEGFVPLELTRLAADAGQLEATVRGRRGDPAHLVKAVTYHRLTFERANGGWRARAVLDV